MQKKSIVHLLWYITLCFSILFIFITCDEFHLKDLFHEDSEGKIITPALEHVYYTGSDTIIEWKNIDGEKVKIELYHGDELIETINNSTENNGEFPWVIPLDMEISDDYRIKIIILDYPPYSGNSYTSSRFFIDNNSWENREIIKTTEAYDVAIALGPDNCPALVLSDVKDGYKRARFFKWDETNQEWIDEQVSDGNSNFYSIAIGSDNIPYIVYTEAMLETRVKKWENNNLTECGASHVHPFLDPIADSLVFEASIALDNNNIPYVSYMTFSLMDLFRNEKPFYLFTSVLKGNEWTTCGEILYRTDTILNITAEDAARLTEPYYIEKSAPAVVNYFDLMALFKLYFLPTLEEEPDDTEDSFNLIQNMEIPLDISIAIDNNNVPVVAYLNLQYTYPNLTKKKVHIHQYYQNEEYDTDGFWRYWGGSHNPINEDVIGDNNSHSMNDADAQSLAIGTDNIPVIIYIDNTHKQIAQVKKWNPSERTWDSLGSPGSCSGGVKPAIVIDKNNNPIVACKNGIKRWDADQRKWICLGFPNQPGNGYGHQSSWLAVNDNYLAVAYILPGERDNVYVKMLVLE